MTGLRLWEVNLTGCRQKILDENPYVFYVHCFAITAGCCFCCELLLSCQWFFWVYIFDCDHNKYILQEKGQTSWKLVPNTTLRCIETGDVPTGRGLNQETVLAKPCHVCYSFDLLCAICWLLLCLSQVIRRFGFCRYVVFAIYLDIHLSRHIIKIMYQKTKNVLYFEMENTDRLLTKVWFIVTWMCNSNRVMCTGGREMEEKKKFKVRDFSNPLEEGQGILGDYLLCSSRNELLIICWRGSNQPRVGCASRRFRVRQSFLSLFKIWCIIYRWLAAMLDSSKLLVKINCNQLVSTLRFWSSFTWLLQLAEGMY